MDTITLFYSLYVTQPGLIIYTVDDHFEIQLQQYADDRAYSAPVALSHIDQCVYTQARGMPLSILFYIILID